MKGLNYLFLENIVINILNLFFESNTAVAEANQN